MIRLSKEARNDAAVKHALAVRAAVSLGNYTAFFKLYRTAPNLSPYLMGMTLIKSLFTIATAVCWTGVTRKKS